MVLVLETPELSTEVTLRVSKYSKIRSSTSNDGCRSLYLPKILVRLPGLTSKAMIPIPWRPPWASINRDTCDLEKWRYGSSGPSAPGHCDPSVSALRSSSPLEAVVMQYLIPQGSEEVTSTVRVPVPWYSAVIRHPRPTISCSTKSWPQEWYSVSGSSGSGFSDPEVERLCQTCRPSSTLECRALGSRKRIIPEKGSKVPFRARVLSFSSTCLYSDKGLSSLTNTWTW
mmetsp:Transcript_8740/g.13867  ORF Transcript_8740/g.13867 Transcript_8740/m.13867 type:complete len:228 (-) Transcript_8740:21-704(-)